MYVVFYQHWVIMWLEDPRHIMIMETYPIQSSIINYKNVDRTNEVKPMC